MSFSALLLWALFLLARTQDEDGNDEYDDYEDENDINEAVVTLTADDFDEFIEQAPRALVEFYAPWCGHCQSLAPEYEKAARAILEDDSLDAVLAKVDATVEKDLASKYGIEGFPTLKFFTGGDAQNPVDYTGGRTEASIVQWVRSRSMPPVTVLANADEFNDFKQKAKIVMVGFFTEDSDEAKALYEVAEANRETVVVGQVQDENVKIDGDEFAFGKLYLFRDFEPKVVTLVNSVSAESIAAFLSLERFPLIAPIGPDNYKEYVDRALPIVWIALETGDEEEKEAVIDRLMPFAMDLKGKLSFTWIDAQEYAQHIQNLGITDIPGVMITENKKFLFDGDISSADDLKAFFDGYAAGTLTAHLKSEPVPESNDDPVFVLVGSEFENVVGKDKDVFVEFYAPWCGHCKRLAPEWEKVGQSFADVDSVVIAKIDATENDTPEEIQGFPTLIFYPKGSTQGIDYNGDRKHEAIVEWIKEQTTGDVSQTKTEL